MRLLAVTILSFVLAGCASPPRLATSVDIQKNSGDLILLRLKITNLDDRVTVPIAVELNGEAKTNGQWSKQESLLHPAAFVLNGKEQREITKFWRVSADAVRTTVIVKEQEKGTLLKTEKAEKVFSGGPAQQPSSSP